MPRTWTEDSQAAAAPAPAPDPLSAALVPPAPADRVLAQVLQLVLDLLCDHPPLLQRFNLGLVPIRQGVLAGG